MRFHLRTIMLTVLAAALSAACGLAQPIDLGEGRQPRVLVDAQGTIFITFGRDRSVFVTRSTDNGKTFDEPIKVADAKHVELGMRRGPRIAGTSDGLIITAITGERGGGVDGDVVAWRSTDAGKNWSELIKVSDLPTAAREGLHALASDGKQIVFVTWLDMRTGDMQVFGAISRDGGKIFEKNQLIYDSPDGHVCECCHPSVTFDASGNIHVMFRNSLGGNRDMWHIVSQDGGKTFVNATQLDEQSWKLNTCPMDGGSIIATEDSFAATYRRQGRIYLSVGGKEHFVGEGTQPVLARGENGIYCAWLEKSARLVLRRPFSDQAQAITDGAIDPVLAYHGKSGLTIAWEHDNHVFVETIHD